MSSNTNLVLDQGNSRLKIFVFDEDGALIFNDAVKRNGFNEVIKNVNNYKPKKAIYAASGTDNEKLLTFLRNNLETVFLSASTPLPISMKYKTPETLGVDRVANVCGATKIFPSQPVLVIDFGTCITYNFIDDNKCFHGGAISPGLEIRAKAMNTFTENLPLIKTEPITSFIGNDTVSCLNVGVVEAVKHEVEGFIGQYKEEFPELKVIFTGGANSYFVNTIESSIFANFNLTAIGLNEILQFNTI